MALPDYSDLIAGTPVEWSTTGGKLITLTSLGNGAVRAGAKSASWIDATLGMPELLSIRLESAVAVAVIPSGREVKLYLGQSESLTAGTDNPGNLTGADATVASGSELVGQLDFVGALALSNALGTSVQKQRFDFYPTCPYLVPVIFNDSGQTLSATAGNHRIVITPRYRRTFD